MTETIKLPDTRLTLTGVNGKNLLLSLPNGGYREGLFFEDAPDWLHLFERDHHHSQLVGVAGGVWQNAIANPATRTLKLLVKGRMINQLVRKFTKEVGDGTQVFRIVARTAESGYRWLTCRARSLAVKYHGSPALPYLAEIELQFVLDLPYWQSFDTFVEATKSDIHDGVLTFQTRNNSPFYPVIQLTGGYTMCSIKLEKFGEVQRVFPSKSDSGRVIKTNPPEKGIFDLAGHELKDFLARWPHPLQPINNTAKIYVSVALPTDDFRVRVYGRSLEVSAW